MDELTFEAAFKELERTVQRLETGDLSLEEALALFERGTELARLCDRRLNEAELRVRQLVSDSAGGYEAAPLEAPSGEEKPTSIQTSLFSTSEELG